MTFDGTRRRLLLRHAVQRAQAPDQVHAVDADHFAAGKNLGQHVQRHAVVGIVERGHQHQAVGDVEVGVAGRQALAAKDDRPRHGQLDDGELLAVGSARGLEAREILGQRRVVRVARVRLDGGDDRGRPDEAGDVVDVAVGVVAGDAAVRARSPGRCRDSREKTCSSCSRLTPGLRCCTSLSRHSSVVSRDPAPLTSIEPPSSTTVCFAPSWHLDCRLPRRQAQATSSRGREAGRRDASRRTWPSR